MAVTAASGASMSSVGTSGTSERADRSASDNTGLLIGAAEFGRNPSHGGWIKVAGREEAKHLQTKNGSR